MTPNAHYFANESATLKPDSTDTSPQSTPKHWSPQ
jgi:hypothetical protein